ncbi:GntR family transcriptional regulator [Nocardia sp. CA-120079]|uniref:GntR family transcriptional regulator n=1 Tax=Nocardia sp. CA-120079 TaxID=3239974 RepID=UPI003D963B9E
MTDRERDGEPAHQLVSRTLRAGIAAGNYRDGGRLPTEAELAQQYRVSRQTVRRAFQDLVADGTVHRVPGRGTFVRETGGRYLRHHGSIEDLMSLSSDTTMEVLTPLHRRVDVEAAGRLRLDTDVVYTITFRRMHEGIPFVVTTVHLPEHIARHIADREEIGPGGTSPHTVIGLLEPHLESPIVEAAQSITVSCADTVIATGLDCAPSHPMLRVDRLYFDATGQIVDLSISHFMPERYTYRVTLRRSTP